MDFRDFRSKRVSEQSQIHFYQSYWVKTTQHVSSAAQVRKITFRS